VTPPLAPAPALEQGLLHAEGCMSAATLIPLRPAGAGHHTMQLPAQPRLIDPRGRRIRKLRVALTDACNFRCFYCMPDRPSFTALARLLTPAEYVRICGRLVELGITQLRLTGGEPTLRPDFEAIVAGLSGVGAHHLGVTTNGFSLSRKLPFLRETRCRHINVSLDSLQPLRFQAITGSELFDEVLAGIVAAKNMGFCVKLNAVITRGVNDRELANFVEFSAAHDIPVRFLEFMKVGPRAAEHERHFVPAAEMIERLRRNYELQPKTMEADSTSFNFVTDHGAEIGFIASESRPFCASCSRLRLTATGRLRACMMSGRDVAVRHLPSADYPRALAQVLALKPTGRLESTPEGMYQIGG
jgi:GTP 3',8-cyclase